MISITLQFTPVNYHFEVKGCQLVWISVNYHFGPTVLQVCMCSDQQTRRLLVMYEQQTTTIILSIAVADFLFLLWIIIIIIADYPLLLSIIIADFPCCNIPSIYINVLTSHRRDYPTLYPKAYAL